MPLDYRKLPLNTERFFVVSLPRAFKRSWLKVDELGLVIETSPRLKWATGLTLEKVEAWCRSKQIPVVRMHGNIKDIKQYL